jgi:hypothetical protein
MKKSFILGAAIAVTTTVAYAQDIQPPSCPPGYQCILVDPEAAAAAANDQANCPPGYKRDGNDNCVLTDIDAAVQWTHARKQAEEAEQRNKETDTNGQVADPSEASIEQCKDSSEGGFDPNTGQDNCVVTDLARAQASPAVRAQQEQRNKETDPNGQVAGPSEVSIEQVQRPVEGGFDPNTGR